MWRLLILMLPTAAMADSLVATRTIRALSLIGPEDVTLVAADLPGALRDSASVIGREARIAIYAGRPIHPQDLGPPAIIERNQTVSLGYSAGALTILTEGRALARGGVGDVIRVMNIASRSTVMGRIGDDGVVRVGPNP